MSGRAAAKCAALAVAVSVHGTILWAVIDRETPRIEGIAGAREARTGASFADMVAGVTTSETATEIVTAAQASAPAETLGPELPSEVSKFASEVGDFAKPTESPTLTPMKAQRTTPRIGSEIAPKASSEKARVEALEPTRPLEEEAERQIEPETTQPVQDSASEAVSTSLRPKRRSERVERTAARMQPEPAPEPARQATEKHKKRAGNAKRAATAGSATGTATAKAAQKGNEGPSKRAGNAAASNYPGLVMRALSRVSRPSVGRRGTAVVSFRVAGNGGLDSVGLARSSGYAKLDQAALRMVQRAAPFPPPPAGARRSFSINIKGR